MRRTRIFAVFLTILLLCAGCSRQPEPVQRQVFAMDTFMTLTAYGDGAAQALADAEGYLTVLEDAISVTQPDSDLSALNQAQGSPVQVSEETFPLLLAALSLCGDTGGALDITAYAAVRAWGFTTGEYRVPDPQELAQLAAQIDYSAVQVEAVSRTVTLPDGMAMDLGAVAKGWAGAQLHAQLEQAGVTSAILSLGGNIQTVGSKPDGSPWRVGIQDPASDQGACLASVAVRDMAVVTSGGYERYFQQDGVTYWHILDPDTAAPARSGVASATIVGPDGTTCDALSTALFVLGAQGAEQLWRDHPELNFDYVLVLEDGSIHITQGLENAFTLAQDDTDRKVTVISHE